MVKIETAEEMWLAYWNASKPQSPARNQEAETRTAFYAGLYSMLSANVAITQLDEDAAVTKLGELLQEVQGWLGSDVARRNLPQTGRA